MPVTCKTMIAVFEGVCTIEEAETLKEWMEGRRVVLLDLADAEHIHTSIVQVLLASDGVRITGHPADPLLREILSDKLVGDEGTPSAQPPDEDDIAAAA